MVEYTKEKSPIYFENESNRDIIYQYLTAGIDIPYSFKRFGRDGKLGKYEIKIAESRHVKNYSKEILNLSKNDVFNNDSFIPPTESEIVSGIDNKGVWVICDTITNMICGYAIIITHPDDFENITEYQSLKIWKHRLGTSDFVNFNTVYIHPNYRGCEFMELFLILACQLATNTHSQYVCALVSDENKSSLKHLKNQGFKSSDPNNRPEKFGAHERHFMLLNLKQI